MEFSRIPQQNPRVEAAALRGGCLVTTSGLTLNGFCSSGLQAIATAAGRILNEGVPIVAADGGESISIVQLGGHMNTFHLTEEHLMKTKPALWLSMIETAEVVADRYAISREAQEDCAFQSQQRTAKAQAYGRFDAEIVPLKVRYASVDRATGETTMVDHVLARDECNRADTTLKILASLKPVMKAGQVFKEGKTVTAGNASQQSDGASACILMEAKEAERRALSRSALSEGAPSRAAIG
jgi:acetyl-CoA C-acetyltransferase